jgi:outer membrane protein assembly factor BamE (lipoprotein component of BamABCDE complex)
MIKTRVLHFIVLCAAAALSACAGTNFVRPDSKDLQVGKSTYAQVVAKMGAPRVTGEMLTNGEKVKTVTYVYATTGGEPSESGVIPARALAFYFYNDLVVGEEFLSSFKSDHSNFDDTKIAGIEKGKTTRLEVIQAFGKPSGTFVRPMVKEPFVDSVGYTYSTTSGGAFSGFKNFRKSLRVAFDADDKVVDVAYSTSGSK